MGHGSEIKTDKEYVAYKRERLEEIVSIIRKSEEQMDIQNEVIGEVFDKIEKFRSKYPWLK